MTRTPGSNEKKNAEAATITHKEEEEILVLFGSQTGNSEQAAETLSQAISNEISIPSVLVTSSYMQLDDFLELHHAKWTSIVVIITSSYGVGQAPLGCYKFRRLCDHIMKNTTSHNTLFDGITFAMLGLGDSKYTTFFQNPTRIHSALCAAGASHIGPLGVADASSTDQAKQISDWIQTIIPILTEAVRENKRFEKQQHQQQRQQKQHMQREKLKLAQEQTIRICQEVIPDYHRPLPSLAASSFPIAKENAAPFSPWQITTLVVLLAILIAILYS
jgi:sulfite reductase alpha subunit-like flavoprotein